MFPVDKMCKVLSVSSSSYYRWLRDPLGKVARRNQQGMQKIRELFYTLKQRYGSVRLTAELQTSGMAMSRPRVAYLMRKMYLQARRRRRFKATTDSKHGYRIVPNHLNRKFVVERKGQVWVSDITYTQPIPAGCI